MALRAEPLRITVFVHDLSGNPIVRAAPLAAALAETFEVEVLGLLPPGREVYAPYRDRFAYRTLTTGPWLGSVIAAGARLARLARGDLLLACKPLFSTLWPAVRAGGGGRRALVLDVEDDEWASTSVDDPRMRLQRLADTHRLAARLAHPLTRRADAVTVATRRLQARYGGTLVRHGPDEHQFDRARVAGDQAAQRRRFGLPAGGRIALFAGVPRPHKGWATLLDALCLPSAGDWSLAVAGVPGRAAYAEAAGRLGGRFHFVGPVANADMPALLAAVDAVPVPQRPGAFAEAQLPAKALEAMAMEVPVIASEIGDLPEILGAGARGWLVPPDDPAALAAAFLEVGGCDRSGARTRAARAWYLANASRAALAHTLAQVVEGALARRAARG